MNTTINLKVEVTNANRFFITKSKAGQGIIQRWEIYPKIYQTAEECFFETVIAEQLENDCNFNYNYDKEGYFFDADNDICYLKSENRTSFTYDVYSYQLEQFNTIDFIENNDDIIDKNSVYCELLNCNYECGNCKQNCELLTKL